MFTPSGTPVARTHWPNDDQMGLLWSRAVKPDNCQLTKSFLILSASGIHYSERKGWQIGLVIQLVNSLHEALTSYFRGHGSNPLLPVGAHCARQQRCPMCFSSYTHIESRVEFWALVLLFAQPWLLQTFLGRNHQIKGYVCVCVCVQGRARGCGAWRQQWHGSTD